MTNPFSRQLCHWAGEGSYSWGMGNRHPGFDVVSMCLNVFVCVCVVWGGGCIWTSMGVVEHLVGSHSFTTGFESVWRRHQGPVCSAWVTCKSPLSLLCWEMMSLYQPLPLLKGNRQVVAQTLKKTRHPQTNNSCLDGDLLIEKRDRCSLLSVRAKQVAFKVHG